MPETAPLFPVAREHLERMTDGLGIWQHARGLAPDRRHGYCTDDVARALLVDLLHARELGWAAVDQSAWRSLSFLVSAFEPASGRFRNFRAREGTWLEPVGSQDAHGRALLALGEAIAEAPDARLREVAATLFQRALPAGLHLTALRARASVLLACDAATRGGVLEARRGRDRLAGRLRQLFERAPVAEGWPWPEPVLTYESGLPVRALIVAGQRGGDAASLQLGLRLLAWLANEQTTADGHLSLVGNDGWWPRGRARARFDQQPIEATALLLAADAALEATGEDRYAELMELAYAWFLGANDRGLALADPLRGGCRDGLRRDGTNENQGAESTLMWLIGLERIRRLRRRRLGERATPAADVRPRLSAARRAWSSPGAAAADS